VLHRYFSRDHVDLEGLTRKLEKLAPPQRIQAIRTLTRRMQAQLFEAVQGFRPIDLTHFVPDSVPDRTWVIHEGRNTLPLFRFFQKRFFRPDPQASVLWGYNHGPTMGFVGPGFFVTRKAQGGEVLIDYTEIPPEPLPQAPRLRPNSWGLSRFVYYNMVDVVRGVTAHISIGRATRKGKPIDAWFVLCRVEG